MGAGRTELMEVLAGVRPEASGEVWLGERRLDDASVADRIEAGIVLVPEDRKTDGLVPTLSVAHNMVLASLRRYLNRFFLSRSQERTAVDADDRRPLGPGRQPRAPTSARCPAATSRRSWWPRAS